MARGFTVEDVDDDVEDGVEEDLLGIRAADVADEPVDEGEPPPCVVPPEEHPATTNPDTTHTLAARMTCREAATDRR